MTRAPTNPRLCDLLRWHREQRGLSQEELAARVEPPVSPDTISNVERGRTRPYRHTLEALCRALDLGHAERDDVWLAWRALRTQPRPPSATANGPKFTLPTARHNLPARAASLIGRDEAVATVCERLLRAKAGLLTITGAGGSGKTSLALAVAQKLVGRFADGVWLVDLAPLGDPGDIAGTIATSVGISEQPGRPTHDTLLEVLEPRSLLLVVDNCEHLLEAAAVLVAELLRTCPYLRVMATSRQPLRVPGEWTWRVPTLPAPDPRRGYTTADLGAYPAVQLFVERAQQVEPGFDLTDANGPAVAHICGQLDGLPLALELAAVQIRLLTAAQIADRLVDALKLLKSTGSNTAPRRQQTLRATLEWSYSLLSSAEQSLFQRLSVFAGGWTLSAAEQVCAFPPIDATDVLDLLARLIDKSLVIFDEQSGGGRYRLLEPVRQYASERCIDPAETALLSERRLGWWIEFAADTERHIYGPEQAARLELLELDLDNMRAVLRCCAEGNEPEAGLSIAAGLFPFWQIRAHFTEAKAWLYRLLQSAGDLCEPRIRAHGLTIAAALSTSAGELNDADAFIEQALSTCRADGFQRELAIALDVAARLARVRGKVQLARALQMEALQTSQSCGDRVGEAFGVVHLAHITLEQEGPAAAALLYERGLALHQTLDNAWGVAIALSGLGDVAFMLGDLFEAERLHQQSLSIRLELGHRRDLPLSILSLAEIALHAGNLDVAENRYSDGLASAAAIGDRRAMLQALEGLALLAAADGEPDTTLIVAAATDFLRGELGESLSSERVLLQERAVTARQALGELQSQRAITRGRRLGLEAAISFAVRQRTSDTRRLQQFNVPRSAGASGADST